MGWTFKTFRVYVDRRFADQDKAVQAALRATGKAAAKADVAYEKRFDGVNELRKMATDRDRNFVQKVEHEALAAKVDALEKRDENTKGRDSGFSISWGILVAAAGIIATLYLLFHK
jgi:hypothetical protein